ncbi:Sulfate adenylyltransferase [hydrothermal vent metagenome]|uniref:sulfate adenylyltransferase n=1 Tax=hydrothermal vent metagenome TaxID=652676 RepID=A0A3B1DMY8_9ZZZZ
MSISVPHGGQLINRFVAAESLRDLESKADSLKTIQLSAREISDLELIATGVFSPLEGFMGRADYESVLKSMHLVNGLPWSLPITLSATSAEAASFNEGSEIALQDQKGLVLAILQLEEKFPFDKEKEALAAYGTNDDSHPGVAYTHSQGDVLLGGKIDMLRPPAAQAFSEHRLTPAETRQAFLEKGWNRIVAFQTRNPVHRAHEYIQKCAMEITDGLLLHPIVGATKKGDIPADVRMDCYKVLLENYYPKDRTMLSVFPAAMRYGGPKEAIFHAICRKNYGVTHFIVGRDHAGVGDFYGTYDAQNIFKEFEADALGIQPLFFDHSFYCKRCIGMASAKTCSHDASQRIALSGTKVREMLSQGIKPPPEFSRPEVAKILIEAMTK